MFNNPDPNHNCTAGADTNAQYPRTESWIFLGASPKIQVRHQKIWGLVPFLLFSHLQSCFFVLLWPLSANQLQFFKYSAVSLNIFWSSALIRPIVLWISLSDPFCSHPPWHIHPSIIRTCWNPFRGHRAAVANPGPHTNSIHT